MRILLDTNVLIFLFYSSARLSATARTLISSAEGPIRFSSISLWEIAIKHGLGKPDFNVPPNEAEVYFRRAGFVELPFVAAHAVAVGAVSTIHANPFDRALLAQANSEGLDFVTADKTLARYPGPIRLV